MAHGILEPLLSHVRRVAGATARERLTDRQLLERYAARHDPADFAALVQRHGRLVRAACRQVLGDSADAEDAFQATFLVLLHKAGSVRWRPSVGAWLYGVAHRIACQARSVARQRQQHESRAAEQRGTSAGPPDLLWQEACAIVHEELDRLPERYRLPLLLRYLEGQSRDEVARVLGWTPGAVKGRLERGRERLRQRLVRRGIDLSAGLLSVLAAQDGRAGVLPAALIHTTTRLAAEGASPGAVAALVRGVTSAPALSPVRLAASMLGVVVLAVGVGASLVRGPVAEMPAAPPGLAARDDRAPPAAPAAADATIWQFSGRVLGPDGKSVAGAKLYLTPAWGYHFEPFMGTESATAGPDGRFAFTAPKAKYHNQAVILSAAAPSFGVGWVDVGKDDQRTDLTVKLVADDVPITGRIVDLEGKPVPGATVRVLQIMASPQQDLGPWLEATKDKTAPPRNRSTDLEQQYLSRYTIAPSAAATADAAGRFRLTGVGRDRLAIVQLDGPTIASQYLRIRTRPGEMFEVPWMEADPEYRTPRQMHTYYGSDFRHVAGPTKPVVGVVRDKDTKKPLAGVTVESYKLAHNPLHGRRIVWTTTDAQGRYRLVGMPKGAGNKIKIVPPRDLPYVAPDVEVPDSPGLDPVTVDVELKRGVWIEGRLTDKDTGKPLRGSLMYHVRDPNPNQDDYLGFFSGEHGVATNEDGTYRIVGLPGPGQVVVWWQEHYLRGADRDDEDGPPADELGPLPAVNFAAFARVNPPKGAESVRRDITLVPSWTFTGTVLGPDGKPLAGALACGLSGWGLWQRAALPAAEFTVREFNPRRPRPVLFRHPATGLVGVAQPPKENGGAVTVRMGPGATVTGRVVDAHGEPRAGVELHLSFRLRKGAEGVSYIPEPIKTDAAGCFRIPALPIGYQYRLSDHKGEVPVRGDLRPGETTDLGDVRIKADE